jgi:hypothetical protein
MEMDTIRRSNAKHASSIRSLGHVQHRRSLVLISFFPEATNRSINGQHWFALMPVTGHHTDCARILCSSYTCEMKW